MDKKRLYSTWTFLSFRGQICNFLYEKVWWTKDASSHHPSALLMYTVDNIYIYIPEDVIWHAAVKQSLIDRHVQVHSLLVSEERESPICQFRQGSDKRKKSFHLNRIILLVGILRRGEGKSQALFYSFSFITRAGNDKHIWQLGADRISASDASQGSCEKTQQQRNWITKQKKKRKRRAPSSQASDSSNTGSGAYFLLEYEFSVE